MEYKQVRLIKKLAKEVVPIEKERTVDPTKEKGISRTQLGKKSHLLIELRSNSSKFGNKSFWLTNRYDWILGKDEMGATILIPLKKEKNNEI